MEDNTYEALRTVIGGMENVVLNDNIYPVVENKWCCYALLEFCKYSLQYVKNLNKDINATKNDKETGRSPLNALRAETCSRRF